MYNKVKNFDNPDRLDNTTEVENNNVENVENRFERYREDINNKVERNYYNRVERHNEQNTYKDRESYYRNHNQFDNRYNRRRAITSYGIILFTTNKYNDILFQLCQRRDSISYSEFVKDNLIEENIPMHISLMSEEERSRCIEYYLKNDPKSLWDDLWVNHKHRIYKNDMRRCCDKFMKNMEKYISEFLKENGNKENQWGFSKGRKFSTETELECALREFEEETTISREHLQILNINPYEENYTGTDGKLYRSVFFTAYIPYIPNINYRYTPYCIRKYFVSEEINKIVWCSYHNCLKKLDKRKSDIITSLNKILLFSRKKRKPRRRRTA